MPQMYNMRKIEEMFLQALKIPDDVLLPKPGEDDRDPASENVAASMNQPIYVLPKQDHLAHLRVHLAFLQSPLFGMNPAVAPFFTPAIVGHLRDHLLNYYLVQSHSAIRTMTEEGTLMPEAEQEAGVIAQAQKLIEQQLGFMPQIMAQTKQMAEQFMQPQMPPDNSMAIAQLRAQVDQMALQMRAQTDQARLQLEQQKVQAQAQTDQNRLQLEVAKMQTDQAAVSQKAAVDAAKMQQDMDIVQIRESNANARNTESVESRVFMNTSDNETAKQLAAAEIASGEKVSVSTGTGINPQP
jgi:exonuclease VII large subunit